MIVSSIVAVEGSTARPIGGKSGGKERLLLFKWEILFDIALASRSAFYLSLEEEK